MHRFKSAILEKLKNCQNGTFEPMHEIQKFFFGQKYSFEALWKCFCNMSQGLPNPGFMQEKVQKGDFSKNLVLGSYESTKGLKH